LEHKPRRSHFRWEGRISMRRLILGSMIAGLLIVAFTLTRFLDLLP
jgi:hypothetical protein